MTYSTRIRWAPAILRVFAICGLLAMLAPPIRAQGGGGFLSVGTRLRLAGVAGDQQIIGNLLRITSDSLAISTGGGNVLLQFPTSSITSLEISEGRNRLGWGLAGAGLGGLVGAATGASVLDQSDGGLAAVAGLFAGGILGAAGGAVVGAIVAPERWRWIPIPGWMR